MRFVLVEMLDKDGIRATSRMILGCTDRDISSIGIITIYSYRMKIELSFRDRNQHIGLEAYHFWSASQPERQSKHSENSISIWVAQQYLGGILFCSQGERGDPKLQSLTGLTLERPREVEQAPKNGAETIKA